MELIRKIIRNLQNAYIRIITFIFLTLFLLIGNITAPFFKNEKRLYVWRRLAKICIAIIFIFSFIRIKTYNIKDIPKTPCVIAMNHRSVVDTLSLMVMLNNDFFVLTEPFDAMPHKLFQQWSFVLGYIPIIRDEHDKKNFKIGMDKKYVVKECVYRVRKEETLVIYPEAHHERHRGLLKFKTGAVRVALEAAIPLIPGAFTGTAKVMSPERNKLHPGKIHLRFGEPMDIEKYYQKQKNRKLVRRLTKELKHKIKELIP
ncbi:lysophospholipid acyltransferase family protein [Chloroflexota bacterium]